MGIDDLTTILFANETEARKAAREEGFEHDRRHPFEMGRGAETIRLVPVRERAYGTGKILGFRWKEIR